MQNYMFERLLVRLAASTYKDKAVFAEALTATATHRGTARRIADVPAILHNIENSRELKAMWEKYRKQFAYAASIEYSRSWMYWKRWLEQIVRVCSCFRIVLAEK